VTGLLIAMAVSALPFVPLLERSDDLGDVANLTGLAGALALWWQVVLGVRQVSERLCRDRLAVVGLHRWLGGCGAFFVLLHPLLETIASRQDTAWLFLLDFAWVESTYTSYGRLALYLFLALWLTSTLARAAIRHRTWRYVHYVSYPLAGLVFLHAWGVGTFLADLPWLRTYWLALAGALVVVVAWRAAVPLWARRYRLTAVRRLSPTVTEVTLVPVAARRLPLRPGPGQFCYLRLGPLTRGHPFSVVRTDDDGTLTFAVKRAGRFTTRLAGLAPGAVLWLDGPYGTFTRAARAADRPAVLVAGGIGITPFVDLVRRHAGPHLTLRHVVSTPAEAVYRDELRQALGSRYTDDLRNGLRNGLCDGLPVDRRARYFVCGSPGFVESTTDALRARGVRRAQVFTESFDC
jgi:predicted ferric reductase